MNRSIVYIAFPLLLLTSCREPPTSPPASLDDATAGVRSRVFYPSLGSSNVLSREDFEYSTEGKLLKKTYYGGDREILSRFERFHYNDRGVLSAKSDYYSNINRGFILIDSTVYMYNGELLSTEKILYPEAGDEESYIYQYDGSVLIKKSKFRNQDLESYVTYEYNNGRLRKETSFDSADRTIQSKEYIYTNGALAETIYYAFSGEAVRRISYSYDRNGKLSVEKVDELVSYSSALPYVIVYEY